METARLDAEFREWMGPGQNVTPGGLEEHSRGASLHSISMIHQHETPLAPIRIMSQQFRPAVTRQCPKAASLDRPPSGDQQQDGIK